MKKDEYEGIGLPIMLLLPVAFLVVIANALSSDRLSLWITMVPLILLAIFACVVAYKRNDPEDDGSYEPDKRSSAITNFAMSALFIWQAINDLDNSILSSIVLFVMSGYGITNAIINIIEKKKGKEIAAKYILNIIGAILGAFIIPALIYVAMFSDGKDITVTEYVICIFLMVLAVVLFVISVIRSVRRYKTFKKYIASA